MKKIFKFKLHLIKNVLLFCFLLSCLVIIKENRTCPSLFDPNALSNRRELKAISRITKSGGGRDRDREEISAQRDSPEDIQPIR